MKKRIIRILGITGKSILLIILFACACIPAVFINTIYGYLPVLFLGMLIIISLICMEIIRRKTVIETDFADGECERGQSVSVGLNIVNKSGIICPRALANLFISNLFGEIDSEADTYFTMSAKETSNISVDMEMPHIGVYKVGIDNLKLYDFFGYFSRKVPIKGEVEVTVMPKLRDLENIYNNEMMVDESISNSKTKISGGTDYVGVREYELGDSMKQIHWKLSAHSHGYMTKIQESNRQMSFSVILDFAAEGNHSRETLMDINDCLIETALSVIENISKSHTSYFLLYTDKDKNIKKANKKNISVSMIELLKSFSVITPDPEIDFPDATEILSENNSAAGQSTNVIICTSRLTDELIQSVLQIKREKRMPELYYIMPADYNIRQKEALTAKMKDFDELGIEHYFVSTQENLTVKSAS